MIVISGHVEGQKLTLERRILATGMTVGKIQLEFSDEWTGFTKTAIFFKDKTNVYYQLVGDDNQVLIPREAILESGITYIGVFGTTDSDIINSEIVGYNFRPGAITDDLITPDPTPSIYEQLISAYNGLKKRIEVLEDAVKKIGTSNG